MNQWLLARWHISLGGWKYRRRQPAAALQHYLKATKNLPDDPAPLLALGHCYYLLEDYSAALQTYESVLVREPSNAIAHAYLGLVYAKFQRFQEAVDEVRRAIRIDPANEDRAFWEESIGVWLSTIGKWEEAIVALEWAIRHKPNARAFFNLGAARSNLKNYQAALEAYEKACRLDPKDAEALTCLGQTYNELKRHDQALEFLCAAVKLAPGSSAAYASLAETYSHLGRFADGVLAGERAIELDPHDSNAYFNLGIAYGEIGRRPDEIGAYLKAAEIDPEDVATLTNLAITYSQCAQYESAIQHWNRIVELKPTSLEALTSLGMDYDRLGRFSDALGVAQRIVQITPDANAHANVGSCLVRLGRYTDALVSAREANRLDPNYSYGFEITGCALQGLNDHEGALIEYQRCLDLNPQNAEALVRTLANMGEAYLYLGRPRRCCYVAAPGCPAEAGVAGPTRPSWKGVLQSGES